MTRIGIVAIALALYFSVAQAYDLQSHFSVAQAYDYVVIGGGTAGLTVASRLSEARGATVAVVEAGLNAEQLPEVYIPGLMSTGLAADLLLYQYPTIPQVNLNGRNLIIKAGKALGGSTVVNAMINTRATKVHYNAWGSLNNDQEWTWDGLLPFFLKFENLTSPNAFQEEAGVTYDPSMHGIGGPLEVGFPNYFFNQTKMWRQAANRLGIPNSPDLTDGNPRGVGIASNTINATLNRRCSAACAYYTPYAPTRPNLTIIYNATVSRIIWSNNTTDGQIVAQSVEYIQNGQRISIDVGKEVILSAGTIGTPKVLELSGVGNGTILRAAGVEPVLELPTVGENLADHIRVSVNAFTNITITKDQLRYNETLAQEQLLLWYTNHTGMYAAVPRSLGLVSSNDIIDTVTLNNLVAAANATLTQRAIEYSNGNPNLAAGISAQLRQQIALYAQGAQLPIEVNVEPGYSGLTSNRPNTTYTAVTTILYTPLSRGRTHITTSDPLAFPATDPNYWGHPMDIAVQVAGLKFARLTLQNPPMDTIFTGEFEPGLNITTDAQITEWLRNNVGSDQHEVGTAAMMPKEIGGVVGTSLKVYGTYNVRVADASVIPFPLNAHIASTVYAIGEKAADMIKRGV